MKTHPPRIEFIEVPVVYEIDHYLDEYRYATMIEGWKVRDLLLDLRNMLSEIPDD
jgi:hypothetical protein